MRVLVALCCCTLWSFVFWPHSIVASLLSPRILGLRPAGGGLRRRIYGPGHARNYNGYVQV